MTGQCLLERTSEMTMMSFSSPYEEIACKDRSETNQSSMEQDAPNGCTYNGTDSVLQAFSRGNSEIWNQAWKLSTAVTATCCVVGSRCIFFFSKRTSEFTLSAWPNWNLWIDIYIYIYMINILYKYIIYYIYKMCSIDALCDSITYKELASSWHF